MVQEELAPRFEVALERRECVALPDPNNVAQEIWIASEQICDASPPPMLTIGRYDCFENCD
jgi:hypothetical protein